MTIGIVGTRDWSDMALLRACLDKLRRRYGASLAFVSGGGRVDEFAEVYAAEYGIPITVHRADWKIHGRAAGPIRNRLIVRDADIVVAFWDGRSRGTQSTLNLAAEAGKRAWIVAPEGTHRLATPTLIHR